MMALALANTPSRTRGAETMISVCGSGLDREPRFVHAYSYALAMRSQVTARRREQFQAALASVVPRPITPTGKEARVMRVDVDDLDVHYRKDGSGLAEIALTAKHTPMTGKQAKKQADESVFFPLPLFDDKQLGSRVETQFSVDDMLVAVVLETAKPAYGLLRAALLAVEEVVEGYTLFDAA